MRETECVLCASLSPPASVPFVVCPVSPCLFVVTPVCSGDVSRLSCVSSEGKMVVLSLAIGLAEQDDFANLPDLQEAPASKENDTTPEKR